MKLNKFLFYILLVLLILNSWACMGKPEAKPQIKPKTKIGLILAENKSARNEFIYKKMQEEIEKQKMKLITGTSELNVEKQEVNIKKMIEEKVEIVILQPLKEPATKDHISMLIEKNIKIILWDYLPEEVTVDAFIAPDYVKAGQLQAQYILNQGRKVIPFVIKGDVLNIKSDKVLEGNLSILQNSPLVENLLIKEANINNTAQSHEILVEELGPNPPDVILVHDEEIALGISKILGEFKSEKKIMLFSLDINKNLLEDMVNGSLVAVDTMPNLLIQVTIDTINSLLEKGTWNYDFQINNKSALIPAKYTPVRIIDKYNFKLLEERFPALSKHEQEEKKEENQQTQNKSTKKQTKLKIKLKDGQEYEVVIPGEIEKMEIEPQKE